VTTLAPTYNFHGHPVRRLTFRGELAFLGREIGGALGYPYGGKRFVSQFTTEWAGELLENVHWFRVNGADLKALKEQMGGERGFANELVLLTEQGVARALFRSGRPFAFDLWTWFVADVAPPAEAADVDALMAAVRALAAAKGIPLKADPKELLAAFRTSLAERGEVLLVDGMPEPTFTTKWADLDGEQVASGGAPS